MIKNMFVMSIVTIISAGVLVSCGGSGSEKNSNGVSSHSPDHYSPEVSQRTISGVVQKGPAAVGGLVIAYELDSKMTRTGKQFKARTASKQGVYSLNIPESWGSIVEVAFTGAFFDETTGEESSEIVNLSAVAPLQKNTQVSVNILTAMVAARTRTLMAKNNWSFQQAYSASSASVSEITGVAKKQIATLDMLRAESAQDSALGLFISGSIVELAKKHNQPTQKVIDQIITNFAIDGQLSGLAAIWEARLKTLTQSEEGRYIDKFSGHLSNHTASNNRVPDASDLPEVISITARPVARAGDDQLVPPGATVVLTGSGEGDATWFQTDHGENRAEIDDKFILNPTFTAPDVLGSRMIFTLLLDDSNEVTDRDTITVTVGEFELFITGPDEVDIAEGGQVQFQLQITNKLGEAIPSKNDLVYSINAPPSNGALSLGGLPFPITDNDPSGSLTVTYAHDGSETQADTAELQVEDERGKLATITINFNIAAVNDPPEAIDDAFGIAAGETLQGNVINNSDFDVDGGALTVKLQNPPSTTGSATLTFGAVTLNPNGDFTYIPNTGISHEVEDSFTYLLMDGRGGESVATVTITVHVQNGQPVATSQQVSTTENKPIMITLAGIDPDNDALTYAHTNPGNGSLSGTAPLLTYTPNAGFLAYPGNATNPTPDSFTFTVNDGQEDSNIATVEILVYPKLTGKTPPPYDACEHYDASTQRVTVNIPVTALAENDTGTNLTITSCTDVVINNNLTDADNNISPDGTATVFSSAITVSARAFPSAIEVTPSAAGPANTVTFDCTVRDTRSLEEVTSSITIDYESFNNNCP